MRIKESVAATIIAVILVYGILSMLTATVFFPIPQGIPPSLSKFQIPPELVDILKWASVSAWGLASASFGYMRALENSEDQSRTRRAGGSLLLSAILFLNALIYSVGAQQLLRLPGADMNPPPDQVVAGVIITLSCGWALYGVINAIRIVVIVLLGQGVSHWLPFEERGGK